MDYPHYLKHVRFIDNGFKMNVSDGGGMTQDLFAGRDYDHKKRNVVLERHELELLIFREKLGLDGQPNGFYELLHTVSADKLKVSEPVNPEVEPRDAAKWRAEAKKKVDSAAATTAATAGKS